jgi:hypothetical protein
LRLVFHLQNEFSKPSFVVAESFPWERRIPHGVERPKAVALDAVVTWMNNTTGGGVGRNSVVDA